jgi:hypothetical protein
VRGVKWGAGMTCVQVVPAMTFIFVVVVLDVPVGCHGRQPARLGRDFSPEDTPYSGTAAYSRNLCPITRKLSLTRIAGGFQCRNSIAPRFTTS